MSFLLAISTALTAIWAAVRALLALTGARCMAVIRWATASKFGPACVGLIMLGVMLALQIIAWRWARAELNYLRTMQWGECTGSIQNTGHALWLAVNGFFGAVNQILPLAEIMAMVSTSLSIEAALFSAVLVRAYGNSMFNLIPGRSGGRSSLEWIRWYFGLEGSQQDVWFGF